MRPVLLLLVVAALAVPAAVLAQAKPDFSGTWTLDTAKSDPPPQRGGGGGGGGGAAGGGGGGRGPAGPVTIKQTGADLMIGDVTYKLDGSEQTIQLQGRGGPQPAKAKAKWDGLKIVIETVREVNGNTITAKEERSLGADGKEMTVETTNVTPNGEQKRKTVFTKS